MKNPNNAYDYDCLYDHTDQPLTWRKCLNVSTKCSLYKKLGERKSVAERVQCEYLAVADTDTVNCEESGEGARKMGE